MGVPVVTFAGGTHRARVGASILKHAGLTELLAEDLESYVDKALSLAGERTGLSALRGSLRERMERSALMDAAASAHDLESAFRSMWDQHLALAGAGTAPEPPADTTLRLNVGGTQRREGWKILNILPGPNVDYVGDCTDLAAFADATVDEVYASHVLEHVGYSQELPRALEHIHRILKPGARLRISVPDLDILLRLYLNPENDHSTRWDIMRIIYGGQIDEYDYHKLGFNWQSLSWYLRQIGFRDIHRVDEFGLFDDTSTLRVAGQPISLNVVARK
jgi:predicted SAM-dependent methyltransferase